MKVQVKNNKQQHKVHINARKSNYEIKSIVIEKKE